MSEREKYQLGSKVILRDGQVATVTHWCDCPAGGEAIRLSNGFLYCWCDGAPLEAGPNDVVGRIQLGQPAEAVGTLWTSADVPVYALERKGRFIYGLYKGIRACWHATGTACSKAVARIVGWVVWLVSDPPAINWAG